MKGSFKDRILQIRDFILAKGKIIFPILLVVAVAITVMIALQAGSDRVEQGVTSPSDLETVTVSGNDVSGLTIPEAELELNAYPAVNELIDQYYTAKASGDVDTIAALQNVVEDMEQIKIKEFSKYIESYPSVDVYTKPGPETGSYIVIAYTQVILSYYPEDMLAGYEALYICANEDGSLYINKGIVSDEVTEYIRQVLLQDDVVELCNKITVEFNDKCVEKPEILNYMKLIEQEVQAAAGTALAEQVTASGGDTSGGDTSDGDASDGDAAEMENEAAAETEEIQEPTGPIYATATTTVNVRSSDSETADRLGKVSSGTRLEVLEQKVNGWSRVVYEGSEGYIKSEYLSVVESADGVEIIGTVTASVNVNVRATASESGEKLGIAVSGEELDLIANEGDWCKVIYNGQIGYVKKEYVQ